MDKERLCYVSTDRLRDMIDENNLMLLVISRFSIPFGFGDLTVGEVCREYGVDCATFLAVSNFVCGLQVADYDLSLNALVGYLKKSHSYFLDFNLPLIRRRLVEALICADVSNVAFLILKYFDDYAVEVRTHMDYENDVLFGYISRLLSGELDSHFRLEHYSSTHTDMSDKLHELTDIIVRHYRQHNNDMLNSVLYDIINCQNDLVLHCRVENKLLVPAVRKLEESVREKQSYIPKRLILDEEAAPTGESLSKRESEIVALVAKGLSNKEIADMLCLSVNTVTTHRRNIASKLQIHSQSGLTIYAIMHGLLDIHDVKSR